jgi:hypothetical protein
VQESATLDLSVEDVAEASWEDLVRIMAGVDPDSEVESTGGGGTYCQGA